MKLVILWETKEDVKTKIVDFHRKMKPIKLNGRKPSKIIVHSDDNKPENLKVFKKMISPSGLVITIDGKPIYDKRSGNR